MAFNLLHRLRHALRLQPIEVITEWRAPGGKVIERTALVPGAELWIGARCTLCGTVTGWHVCA